MPKIRSLVIGTIFVVAAATVASAALAANAGNKITSAELERPLIGVLQSNAPPQEKALVCKKLAICGNQEAVPALAALLADEKLAAWARIALEAIPALAAGDALREAAGKLQGRLLVGVINSIGVRRDAQAVGLLVPKLNDADGEVVAAAAVALGRIGGAPAAKALENSLRAPFDGPATAREAIAQGCVLCAEKFLADGDRAEAVKLYDLVRNSGVPKQQVLEATRGAILARQSAGVPLLVELLQSPDKSRFALGLSTARELPGPEVTAALVAEEERATPQRQALLILALADRGDAAPLAALLKAASSGSVNVRIAAIRVLERKGDASCVPTLLEAACEDDANVSQAAAAALAALPGKNMDAVLIGLLSNSSGKPRRVLVELIGQRRIKAAVPDLLKAADDTDPQLRLAALTALGATVGPADLPALIDRVVSLGNAEQAETARAALESACLRMPDREACAEKLIAAIARTSVPAKCRLVKILGAMGGAKALEAVTAAAKDPDAELRDAGSRALGEWMNMDAAPKLLDLAKTTPDGKLRVRALRGYIRLARQFSPPPAERLVMCRNALALAGRDEEKKLVLEVLGRIPSPAALALVTPHLAEPGLQEAAALAAVKIGEKLAQSQPAEVAAAMRQVLQATKNKDLARRAQTLLDRPANGKGQ
jgi:HEAT repeat protein